MNNPIAKLNNLPEFGDKITKNNIQINDIITCEVNNRQIYCKVIDVTNTMIKVNDLIVVELIKNIFDLLKSESFQSRILFLSSRLANN